MRARQERTGVYDPTTTRLAVMLLLSIFISGSSAGLGLPAQP